MKKRILIKHILLILYLAANTAWLGQVRPKFEILDGPPCARLLDKAKVTVEAVSDGVERERRARPQAELVRGWLAKRAWVFP